MNRKRKGELRSWNCVQRINAPAATVTVFNSSIAARLEREKRKKSTFDGERGDRLELEFGEREFGVMAACV